MTPSSRCDACGAPYPQPVGVVAYGFRRALRCAVCERRAHIAEMLDTCRRKRHLTRAVALHFVDIEREFQRHHTLSDESLALLERIHAGTYPSDVDRTLLTRPGQLRWMERLGQYVRRTRELLGWTQTRLANEAGVSQAAVSRIEVGKALGTPHLTVVLIQRALGQGLQRRLRDEARDGGDPPAPTDRSDAERWAAILDAAPRESRDYLIELLESLAETWRDDPSRRRA